MYDIIKSILLIIVVSVLFLFLTLLGSRVEQKKEKKNNNNNNPCFRHNRRCATKSTACSFRKSAFFHLPPLLTSVTSIEPHLCEQMGFTGIDAN